MKAHIFFFQINELHIRELEELSPAYTLPENTYKSLIMAKNTIFQRNILSSVYIIEYILIPC